MFKNNTIKVSENGISIFTGNCLELAARGILNQVPCKETFFSGCPDGFFFGLEIYKCNFRISIYSRCNAKKNHLSAEIISV